MPSIHSYAATAVRQSLNSTRKIPQTRTHTLFTDTLYQIRIRAYTVQRLRYRLQPITTDIMIATQHSTWKQAHKQQKKRCYRYLYRGRHHTNPIVQQRLASPRILRSPPPEKGRCRQVAVAIAPQVAPPSPFQMPSLRVVHADYNSNLPKSHVSSETKQPSTTPIPFYSPRSPGISAIHPRTSYVASFPDVIVVSTGKPQHDLHQLTPSYHPATPISC